MARLPYTVPYDPDFLGAGFSVPLPQNCCKGCLFNSGQVIDYIHFSLVQHADRRSALFTAHNVDASQLKSVSRTGWDTDPRISLQYQTDNAAYASNPWDRGHLVRRAAVAWGDVQRAKDASDSTFYYPVAAMQHATFNQSDSKWLGLENWILQKAGDISDRLCVFTGPIYTKIDQFHRGYRIPSAFFKIVVLRDPTAAGNDLSALGIVMTQNEGWRLWRNRRIDNLEPYLVGIQDIEAYTGLHFGELSQLDEFNWRQVQFRDRTLMHPIKIDGPEDILFMGDRRRARGGATATRRNTDHYHPPVLGGQIDADCPDCDKKRSRADKRIQSLSRQVDALTGFVEELLEDNRGNFKKVVIDRLTNRFIRVVGGRIVSFGDFPECAAVGNDQDWFCTGVLIRKNVVLTAAHCAPDITRVFLGGRQISDLAAGQIIEVTAVHVHPDYRRHQVPSHDIALLVLSQDADHEPVQVATSETVDKEDNMMLVGFGSDDPNGMTGYGTKRMADAVRTATFDLPSEQIQRLQYTHGFHHAYEFHTGRRGLGVDTCYGDSGGPAYIIADGGRTVAGLTSRAAFSVDLPCGDGGVYTRIDPYLPWIESVLAGQDSEPPGERDAVGVYIAAALPNPAGPDPGHEWIEIKNISAASIDISDYTLADKQGGRIPLSGVIDPAASLRIFVPRDSSVKLANKGDNIVLSQGDAILHKVSYAAAGSGQIITFDPPPLPDGPDDGGEQETGADPC